MLQKLFKHFLLLSLFSCVLVVTSISAEAAKDPFRVEIIPMEVESGSKGALQVIVVVPPKHHLYRDMMSVTVLDGNGLGFEEAQFPDGEFKQDPANPSSLRELYKEPVQVRVPFVGSETGEYSPLVEVRYQGCKETLCYMPAVHQVAAKVNVVAATSKSESR